MEGEDKGSVPNHYPTGIQVTLEMKGEGGVRQERVCGWVD